MITPKKVNKEILKDREENKMMDKDNPSKDREKDLKERKVITK